VVPLRKRHSDLQIQYALQVGAKGRIVLPAKVRKRLDLNEGEKIVLTMRPDGALTLESSREQARKLWGAFAKKDGRHLVDELISERRVEAAKNKE